MTIDENIRDEKTQCNFIKVTEKDISIAIRINMNNLQLKKYYLLV